MKREVSKRRMNSSGKKDDRVKRFITVSQENIENYTNFGDLPNEIYRDIFDYLSSFDILQSFDGLNHRLNAIVADVPMKLRFEHLTTNVYKRVLKQIGPKIIQQTVAINLGQAFNIKYGSGWSQDSEYLIDLFIQSFHFAQFSNLRCLSLTSPSIVQLKSCLIILPQLDTLRSFRLLEQNHYDSQPEAVCQMTLANNWPCSPLNGNRLTHMSIETSPPFKTMPILQTNLSNKISLNCLHVTIRCAFFFYAHALTYFPYDVLARLVPNMTYCRVNITAGTFTSAFRLIRRFSQVTHLSVRTIADVYANGYQWAELIGQMPNLVNLDLDIYLDACRADQELPSFQTNFWLDRQWIVQCRKQSPTSLECQIRCRTASFQ